MLMDLLRILSGQVSEMARRDHSRVLERRLVVGAEIQPPLMAK
jgi:hypothetical protein